MHKVLSRLKFLYLFSFVILILKINAQEVDILTYDVDTSGIVQLGVGANAGSYYLLTFRNDTSSSFSNYGSITIGQNDTILVSDGMQAYPQSHYQVLNYDIASPLDIDNDGIDDYTEYINMPFSAPFNAASSIDTLYGAITIQTLAAFENLAIVNQQVDWAEYLNERSYVKFLIEDFSTSYPKIYFINSKNYMLHADFAHVMGIDFPDSDIRKGEIIYHANTESNNGSNGLFTFNYSNGFGEDFATIQRTHDLLAVNMPVLKNNLSYFVTANSENEYASDYILFQQSRVNVLLESELYNDIDYWLLNKAESYGLLQFFDNNTLPGIRDIAIYDYLPNTLPRVSGIITSTFQSPLSHINLRAIQNNIPNTYIREVLEVDSISSLIGQYVHYSVIDNQVIIEPATLDEVNDWFENIRPNQIQTPSLDLSVTSILPLDEIDFSMSNAFGAKCANVAAMRKFGFSEGTIPDGYGVPFYFYHEFMNYNGFFTLIDSIMQIDSFQLDRSYQMQALIYFQERIKDGVMPNWMLHELSDLQAFFPAGTSIRCRSSTNNEDLQGFSGAGLYTSKTQHPNEGHIAKSVKQVYASMWNLRAFEEREFYKIDHFKASMGLLCHPNFTDEKVNGVGVSFDPLYNTENTFYLNTQFSDELITNPSPNTVPEEILLYQDKSDNKDFIVVRRSSLSDGDTLLMSPNYLTQMRDILKVIHNEFKELYQVKPCENFAMDIEFKITQEDALVVKQARPWIFNDNKMDYNNYQWNITLHPNPTSSKLAVYSETHVLIRLQIFDTNGVLQIDQQGQCSEMEVDVSMLKNGLYFIQGYDYEAQEYFSNKFIKY